MGYTSRVDMGDVGLIKLLLRKGNAVWNLVDNLGCVRSPFSLLSLSRTSELMIALRRFSQQEILPTR